MLRDGSGKDICGTCTLLAGVDSAGTERRDEARWSGKRRNVSAPEACLLLEVGVDLLVPFPLYKDHVSFRRSQRGIVSRNWCLPQVVVSPLRMHDADG
jgi:hypothetical protein